EKDQRNPKATDQSASNQSHSSHGLASSAPYNLYTNPPIRHQCRQHAEFVVQTAVVVVIRPKRYRGVQSCARWIQDDCPWSQLFSLLFSFSRVMSTRPARC